MSAKAAKTADEPNHGVEVAAESSYGELSGTRHIVINGEPLCGHPQVEKHIESGRYGTETTRYPLNDFETCKTCGSIYASEHGSQHGTFAEFAEFSEDDWVQIETAEGERITGRVRRGADTTDMPSRRITVVASDEPRERWVYGVEKEVTVAVREGEKPVIKHGSVMDDDYSETPVAGVSEISEPENNIDVRTGKTMEELRDLGGDDVQNVMANGQGRKEFSVYSSDYISERELWSLLDRIYKAGYEIRYVSPASERAGDRASIGVTADELCREHDVIVTDGGQAVDSTDQIGASVEVAGQKTLVVCMEDYGTDEAYSGYGEYIHVEEDGCDQAPEGRRIVFDVREGGGSADLCPDCDWPDWVRSLHNGADDSVEVSDDV
jgi:hypothetical protein